MALKDRDRANLKFADLTEVNAAADIKFLDFEYAWHHGGMLKDGTKMQMKDALAMWEAPLYIPKVINNQIQEAVEPLLIGQSLLQSIPYQVGTHIELPVAGAVDGDFDVGEEESFPELRVAYGPGSQISRIGKTGVAVKFTEEVLRYSQFDVVSLYTRQAARALARHKEEKIWNMIINIARTTHDNASPLSSTFGTTTGRALTGALNGSIVMDDVFEMFAQVMHNGFVPNLVIVHPLTWLMFIQDAQLRSFAIASQQAFFGNQWSGNPAVRDFPSAFGGEGVTGAVHRAHPNAPVGADGDGNALPNAPIDFSQQMTAMPNLPGYLGIPFQMIVTPFMPYDAANNTTSIIMADRAELGFFIEDHGLQTSEWTDPETDIFKIKMKERYALNPKNRGLGVAVAKNVVVTANQILLPAQTKIDVAGSIDEADRTVAVP